MLSKAKLSYSSGDRLRYGRCLGSSCRILGLDTAAAEEETAAEKEIYFSASAIPYRADDYYLIRLVRFSLRWGAGRVRKVKSSPKNTPTRDGEVRNR